MLAVRQADFVCRTKLKFASFVRQSCSFAKTETDPKFEFLGAQLERFQPDETASVADIKIATIREILKEIRQEKLEKVIVGKRSLLHTNDYIETGTKFLAQRVVNQRERETERERERERERVSQ